MMSPLNLKYITYHIAIREIPSHNGNKNSKFGNGSVALQLCKLTDRQTNSSQYCTPLQMAK